MTVTPLASVPIDALSRASAGDQAAFSDLVCAHESMVFSIAWHVLRDRHLTEELAQEVFLQLYRSLGTIESAEHLVFWLRRVKTRRMPLIKRRKKSLPERSRAKSKGGGVTDLLQTLLRFYQRGWF